MRTSKLVVISLVGAVFGSGLMLQAGATESPSESGPTTAVVQGDRLSRPSAPISVETHHDGEHLYENDQYHLRFRYSAPWTVEERPHPSNEGTADRVLHQVFLKGPFGEQVTVHVFAGSAELAPARWLAESGALTAPGVLGRDPDVRASVVDGQEVWVSESMETGPRNTHLVFQRDDYVYHVTAPLAEAHDAEDLARSLIDGVSRVSDSVRSISGSVASCCADKDSYTNTYPCCAPHGNCTWKAEKDRAGNNNFYFSGSGRDAYRWMTLARKYTSYGQGGTIPTVGAVLVAIDDYGRLGHVGTVKQIKSDGSIVLTEQNCGVTCSREKTYSGDWLRSFLAGYIYTSSSLPTPTAKLINKTGETIAEDYNQSSTYNFGTYGPGSFMSSNNNERAWRMSSAGRNGWMHYVLSKTGSSENHGRWRATTQVSGFYEIQAWIPNSTLAGATAIRYDVGGVLSAPINQSGNRGRWVQIRNPGRSTGYWSLGTGTYNIYLRDNANGTANQNIAFDAIRFIKR